MTTIVSRNTIKLSSSASSGNDWYVGYNIILTRITDEGKELKQTKRIIAYDGSTKIATIDGIWDFDFIPKPTDRYQIVPAYGDVRVSTNTAIQTLDYVTSKRYGKGLDPKKDLYMPSWLESARLCDTQSDVTLRVTSDTTGLAVGAVYTYSNNGTLHWQGAVKSKKPGYVTFTKVIGKLSNKWNSWKYLPAGALVYNDNKLYTKDAAGASNYKPAHTSGSTGGYTFVTNLSVTKINGTGPSTLSLYTAGNPVQDINERGVTISGYSLYDADGIDYWRLVGWDQHDQRYVTRHQTNLMLDTSTPVFDNTNSLLEHFNGIMRYSNGKYHLEVESGEDGVIDEDDVRQIDNTKIIGKIRLSDEGIKSSYNSLTVAYADPANKFEAKNISFFNSNYLKADRNVPKKGNLAIPGITNYYNARLLADKFLNKSRFGLTISMNLAPEGVLLLAGRVIEVTNPRYNWTDKRFRIENITHNTDATVDIVAKEYDDSFYKISNISKPPAVGKAGESNLVLEVYPTELRATGLVEQDEQTGSIEITWTHHPKANATMQTEIYSSPTPLPNLITSGTDANGAIITPTPHGLAIGARISNISAFGWFYPANNYYTVSEVISNNLFNLAEISLPPGLSWGPEGTFSTMRLIASLDYPISRYVDVIPVLSSEANPPENTETPPEDTEEPVEEEKIPRYYWIRYKIIKDE